LISQGDQTAVPRIHRGHHCDASARETESACLAGEGGSYKKVKLPSKHSSVKISTGHCKRSVSLYPDRLRRCRGRGNASNLHYGFVTDTTSVSDLLGHSRSPHWLRRSVWVRDLTRTPAPAQVLLPQAGSAPPPLRSSMCPRSLLVCPPVRFLPRCLHDQRRRRPCHQALCPLRSTRNHGNSANPSRTLSRHHVRRHRLKLIHPKASSSMRAE
jgi:hypothetical protein